MTARRAAFLDRDGVLNRRPPPHEYVTSADDLEIVPEAAEAVASIRRAGFVPIVVSNQRGVARGSVSERTLGEIEDRLRDAGMEIDAFYYCRHDLGDACACRKPQPGLLVQAAAEHGLALGESVMIGDEESDVEAGRAAGCRTIRVGVTAAETAADAAAPDLAAAARLLASS